MCAENKDLEREWSRSSANRGASQREILRRSRAGSVTTDEREIRLEWTVV